MRKQQIAIVSTSTLDVRAHGFQFHVCDLHNYFDKVEITAIAIVSEYASKHCNKIFKRAILQLKLKFI